MHESAIATVATWTGLNVILTLVLAINVSLNRRKGLLGNGDERRLEAAIRAHGNNIEYVPMVLIAILSLASLGVSLVLVHILSGVFFIARVLHAHGIQQDTGGSAVIPKTKVIGNRATWAVMLISGIMTTYLGVVSFL